MKYLYLGFISCLYLFGTTQQLWDQDEAAYAGMARQMVETGNWIVPEFMWSDVHCKPPLHIWNIAVAYKIFGINEFSVRLSSILFSLLTYLLVYKFALQIADKRSAFTAMVIASTSLLVPMLARIAVTDATLLFFFTLCSYSLYAQLKHPSWKWVSIFWTSFALALLTKGPPVVIFSGIFAVLLFVFYPERKKLFSLHPWFFLPLACAPLLVWAYATTKYDDGRLLSWMIDFYVVKRVNSSMFGQTGPPGTHLVIIIISFLPYLLYLPGTTKNAYREFSQKKEEVLFLVAWFVAAWFIYEFSPSKLPSYTVAAHIPLAILVARYSTVSTGESRYAIMAHYLLNGLLLLGIAVIGYILQFPVLLQVSWGILGIVLLGLQSVSFFSKQTKLRGTLVYCGLAVLLQAGISVLFLAPFDLLKLNTRSVSEAAHQKAIDESAVLIGNDTGLPPSLPFYLKQHYTHIKSEYYLSEWIASYYDQQPFVLILSKSQFDAFNSFVSGPAAACVASYQLEHLSYFDYYIVVNPEALRERKAEHEFVSLTVAPPTPPVSEETYLRQISQSKEWMDMIAKKAIEKKVSTQEMLKRDARFLYKKDSSVYQYELRIRKSNVWLHDLLAKAKKENVPLEEMIHKEAVLILEKRNIQ